MTTYFHEDLSSWSESVAVKKAISEVRATSDLTKRNDSVRRTNADQERRSELSIGEILFHFPGSILEVAKGTLMTTGALHERRDVYAATIEAGAMDELLAMTLSYTNHRGIVGIRVKSDGTGDVSIDARLAAAQDSIERNGGLFKEDDAFFKAIGALPPPNNFERILANLVRSDEYADEKLDDPDTADALFKVLMDYAKRNRWAGGRRGGRSGGSIRSKDYEVMIGLAASRTSVNMDLVIECAEALGGVPMGVLVETENWHEKTRHLRQISALQDPVAK